MSFKKVNSTIPIKCLIPMVEDRKIIEMNLDFPHVFSTVGETSRRFGRREGIMDCEADGGKKGNLSRFKKPSLSNTFFTERTVC